MIKSTFGALKKAIFTLVLLLLTTWASAPLSEVPALCSTHSSWKKAHTILIRHSKNIDIVAREALKKHKQAITAYAMACGATLEIEEHNLSLRTTKRAYEKLINTFAEANAGGDLLKTRVFKRIRQALHKSHNYLIRYLKYEEIVQNGTLGPATAPQMPESLPTFKNAAGLIAATYGYQQTPIAPTLRTHTGPKPEVPRLSRHPQQRPQLSQPKRRNAPPQRSTSSKNYTRATNGCWWVTIRNHSFMLVNEAGQFRFPALCHGKAATFSDHRNKETLQPFPLSEKERSLVFRVLLKAGIRKSDIKKTLKHSHKFKEEIKRSARKVSTRSTTKECGICYTNKPKQSPACTTCKQPMCLPCVKELLRRKQVCPFCRNNNLKL